MSLEASSPASIFPLITPQNSDFTHYRGWYRAFYVDIRVLPVNAQNSDMASRFVFEMGGRDDSEGLFNGLKQQRGIGHPHSIHIQIDPLPPSSTRRIYSLISSRIRHLKSLPDILRELREILDLICVEGGVTRRSDASSHVAPPLSKSYYLWLRAQLTNLGYANIASLSARTDHIAMRYHDAKNREHVIEVRDLKNWYERVQSIHSSEFIAAAAANAPVASSQQQDVSHQSTVAPLTIQHHLPLSNFQIKFTQSTSMLKDILVLLSHQVDALQSFWDQMDDLDQNTWIIEPSHPNRAHTSRSVSIGQHCSIRIQVDPLKPNIIPVCEFIGSDTIINPLKERWMKHVSSMWSYDIRQRTLRENMEHVLEIKFPSPKEANEMDEEEHTLTCGICYYAHSETGELPTVVCENIKCLKPYHWTCIMEWFTAQNAKTTFDSVQGECLYCGSSMSVKKRVV